MKEEFDDSKLLQACIIISTKGLSDSSESFNKLYEKILPDLNQVYTDISYISQPEVVCQAIIKIFEANHYAVLFNRSEFLSIEQIESLGDVLKLLTSYFTETMIHSSL